MPKQASRRITDFERSHCQIRHARLLHDESRHGHSGGNRHLLMSILVNFLWLHFQRREWSSIVRKGGEEGYRSDALSLG